MTTNPRTPPTPEEQEEVVTPVPEAAQSDAARRLVNQARGELTAGGHTESQIREWAEEYVSETIPMPTCPGSSPGQPNSQLTAIRRSQVP